MHAASTSCRILLACLLGLAGGCERPRATLVDVAVKLESEPDPPQVGPADLTLTLTDSTGKPLSAGALEVEANMNHAGMKPVFAMLQETAPGRYEGKLEFTMAGDWFLLVIGKLADGRQVNEKIDVRGVTRP